MTQNAVTKNTEWWKCNVCDKKCSVTTGDKGKPQRCPFSTTLTPEFILCIEM